jgi:hypothetical protein
VLKLQNCVCWAWLFESWEGDFKVVQCVGARLPCFSGQHPLGQGSILVREICFIIVDRQTQFSNRQNC